MFVIEMGRVVVGIDPVVAAAREDRVVAGTGQDAVVAVRGENKVVSTVSEDRVVPTTSEDSVVVRRAKKRVARRRSYNECHGCLIPCLDIHPSKLLPNTARCVTATGRFSRDRTDGAWPSAVRSFVHWKSPRRKPTSVPPEEVVTHPDRGPERPTGVPFGCPQKPEKGYDNSPLNSTERRLPP